MKKSLAIILLVLPTLLFAQGHYLERAHVFQAENCNYILHWLDHRSIGQIILSSASAVSATNPQGWFNDPTLDVISPQGIAQFQQNLLLGADQMVARALNTGSQGVIVWDIEGQACGPYLGDPRVLAPEMRPVADQFFQKFRNAGLRVGVLIRPQSVSGCAEIDTSNPVRVLTQKINYARSHWNTTLYYVDSNTTQICCNFSPTSADFRRLAASYSDSLFIPEWQDDSFYVFSAPYDELRQGVAETPAQDRPGFSVINVADGDINGGFTTYWNQLIDGVHQGDILLYRVFFNSGEIPYVIQIYNLAQ